METGDKVLVLLLAKLACCVGLGLAATGTLGALGAWLLDGTGRWLVGGALVALVAWIVLGRQSRPPTLSEPAGPPQASREEQP